MRIDRVTVKNFRNLAEVDVPLQRGTVLVGENRAGKSNFIHALRLVLDPSLPNSDRYLRREDFWDGLSDGTRGWDPMEAGEEIEVSVDLSDFEDEPEVITALSDALIEGDPMIARMTYRYAPSERSSEETHPVYEWQILGGARDDARVPFDLRRYVWVEFLHALRDAQGDLARWSRSPMRSLLEAAAESASDDELADAAEAIGAAHSRITELEPVKALGHQITDRTTSMVGDDQALQAELGVAPLEPRSLIRSLRIFVDGDAHRPLGSASLGSQNVLYLTLLELGLEERLAANEIAHVLLAIEEPEAHLHPHLQRLIFRRLLREDQARQTVLVTTHSPHIASVADPRTLVVFRSEGAQTRIAAASNADLPDAAWADIERYLDATRAEMVFARRVLLVEGFAEQVLVPTLAKTAGIDLDQLGITVCGIHGTHFESYIRFLEALDIRWAVMTDGDPDDEGSSRGERRVRRLTEALDCEDTPAEIGIFVGDSTFEMDLFAATDANAEALVDIVGEVIPGRRDELQGWLDEPPELKRFRQIMERVGKGRLAQRLAQRRLELPAYTHRALQYLMNE